MDEKDRKFHPDIGHIDFERVKEDPVFQIALADVFRDKLSIMVGEKYKDSQSIEDVKKWIALNIQINKLKDLFEIKAFAHQIDITLPSDEEMYYGAVTLYTIRRMETKSADKKN